MEFSSAGSSISLIVQKRNHFPVVTKSLSWSCDRPSSPVTEATLSQSNYPHGEVGRAVSILRATSEIPILAGKIDEFHCVALRILT